MKEIVSILIESPQYFSFTVRERLEIEKNLVCLVTWCS